MDNVWQAMEEEAERIAFNSHCEKCLEDYDRGRVDALREWAPRAHEWEIAMTSEISKRDEEIKILRALRDSITVIDLT